MATRERKISFCTLFKKMWITQEMANSDELIPLLKFIIKQTKLSKQLNLKDSKFYFLDSCIIDKSNTLIEGFFSSAKHAYRPNLIDSKTGDERPSPKRLTEGEKEKTHFVIKICPKETFIALEQNGNGVSILQIVNYLNTFLKSYLIKLDKTRNFSFNYAKVGDNNFLHTLNNLKRVRIAQLYLDKSLLGSKFLGYSNRTISVQNDLVLTATAETGMSIKETAVDLYNASRKEDSVSNLRIYGNDKNGTNIIMDTSFIEKVDSLKLNLNETTGEIQTIEIHSGLKALIQQFK